MHTVEHVIERVVAEFQEMPGMRLTVEQVGRLFGIERSMCQRVLDALVGATVLRLTTDGHYARATDGTRVRPAKAELRFQEPSAKAS